MTNHTGRRLAAMFTALLAACSGRDLPGDEATATTDTTTGTTGETTTDPTTTSNPTTATTTTASPSEPPIPSTDPTFDTSQSECVYDDHFIKLTPEEYEAWLNGELPGGTDSATDTIDPGTDTDADESGTATASTGTTADLPETTTSTDEAGTTSADDGWSFELCVQICDFLTAAEQWDIESCTKTGIDPEGNIDIKCVQIVQHCDGRSHACITSRGAVADEDPVAAHLARAAHDEAASVHAFVALHAELTAFGAPAELLANIQRAAADEVRHAAAVAALASNRGAVCRPPARTTIAPRTLLEIAVENAVEGCVRETWAALLAAHQATYAADPDIRRIMPTIAADEARHAELAWAIDAWLRTTLDAASWTAVEAARSAAARSVITSVADTTPPDALVHTAGLPDRPRATRLVHSLAAALWSSAA